MKDLTIQLEQLVCPTCAQKITMALNKTVGVETAEVLFNSSKAQVQYDETKVTVAKLTSVVTDLGYEVISVS